MKRKGHKTEGEELENRENRSGKARAGGIKKKEYEINYGKVYRESKKTDTY